MMTRVTSAISIGKGTIVSAQSGVSKSLEGGQHYFGTPAEEARRLMKELVAIRQLPPLIDRLKKL